MKTLNKLLIGIIVVMGVMISILYISTYEVENRLQNNLNRIFLSHVDAVAHHIERFIKKYCKENLYTELKSNPQLRDYLQDALELTTAPPHKFVYILYRDKQGHFRYLLDGSLEDKGEFNQKLDVNSKIWNRAYKSKQALFFSHQDSDILYITYLYPIVLHGSVQGIIAIDFTNDLPATISTIISPLKKVFAYLFFAIFLLLALLAYQGWLYLHTKKSALTDPLTGAYNRNYLHKFLYEINPQEYAILMLDIDHFKKVNDNYGHKAGDFVLKNVYKTLHSILRNHDLIFRYGGEEFIIFIKRNGKEENIIQIAERIRTTFYTTAFIYEEHSLKVTVSIGIILHPEKFKSIKDAIKKADEFLYEAKRTGRNKICYNTDYTLTKTKTTREVDIIKDAIDNRRLFIELQPIYDINSMQPVRYEVLVRLKDREGNVIYPGAFLENIAYTTLYNSLTKEVLRQTFDTIQTHKVPLSINLNFSDITDNVVYEMILQEIEKNRELANFLVIELLENEALPTYEEHEDLKKRLQKLKEYGIKIAIDDFGSGYSNFEIFKYLPIDILKIDGTLIKEIEKSKVSYLMVKSITSFAQAINIKVVAEFIENEKILQTVSRLNIQYGQGFYLGKPSKHLQ
ncbi:diguanylate cyclase/phosphodiesterase [Nitratiruptor sp. YY08-26]|uniref:putative bifunctional diguanylate cyclase/phosphodiesterase n=1 Tax=unclassified Nitratiruptor TaxID=2624044 RepID=UPI00191658C8|nr:MULTISPECIES: bifunctional diguanylate cyclase/phosphodiesterase [unclassified Nitratiruptor]BCD63030.1 diguanylate cyclase/phosphodiesterase [Nitratiruptor sp. YY08-13]BCD66965.1 diguanylate cyclase/phosphodiesterase [Nitratiruptor sp. YY08-26]